MARAPPACVPRLIQICMQRWSDKAEKMESAKLISHILFAILPISFMHGNSSCAHAQAMPADMPNSSSISTPKTSAPKRIVIVASSVLDGKGNVLRDERIVIEGTRIVAIDSKAEPISTAEPVADSVEYDLRGLTVLPGWIDAHVHITWSFGSDGKNVGQGGTTQEAAFEAASNAWLTLMGGFTTIQSVGSPTDIPLRNAIAKGSLPGPRILTAAEPLFGQGEKTGTRDEIRAFVRKQKQAGADLIKIYAAGGMTRGTMTMSQEQLNAACDEAKKQGLRTLVHAYR